MSTKSLNQNIIQHTGASATQLLELPVIHSLASVYVTSIIIAVLMVGASIAGLLYPEFIYPTDELVSAFVPSDFFNLAVGLPLLLISMWLTWREKLVGLLSWPSALFYVLYMYIPYLLKVPFSMTFLPYLILVTLSIYALIGLIASMDGEAIQRKLANSVMTRLSAGILLGLAIFIILRQTTRIVASVSGQMAVDPLEIPSWIADFTVVIPMLLIVGIQLWQHKPLGYMVGGGLLLGYGVMALGVIPFFFYQASRTATPLDVGGIIAILIMVVLCFIPLVFFVRGAISRDTQLQV